MNLDKFYTKPEIAKKCFDLIKSQIKEKDLIIEPSAGNGAFIKYIIANKNNYLFYDIKPENDKIIKQNYLKLNTTIFMKRKNKIHVIGNPPFGRQSSLAIKFIKKSAEFADTISFILPKSFKKTSMINKIPLNFHLFLQKDLPKNSFLKEGIEYDVPCVFQIWIKKDYDRKKQAKAISKYFNFVKKEDNPDVAIRRVGSNAGKMYFNIIDRNPSTHYFLKLKDKSLISKMKPYNKFNNSVGPLSISKQELIKFYNHL